MWTRAIEGGASRDPIMCTDGLAPPLCDGLADWGCRYHCRVGHGESVFVERGDPGSHINGTGSLRGHAKSGLVEHQGMPQEDLCPHLKECELRFNMRRRDMYKFMLRELRKRPLN